MPLYEYKCESCGQLMEDFFKFEDRPERIRCCVCGGDATIVPISFKGGIIDELPSWLDRHVTDALCDPSEAPITTRSEWKRKLEEKGVIPVG